MDKIKTIRDTSPKVAKILIDELGPIRMNSSILEPSAGCGNLVAEIYNALKGNLGCFVHCVELNTEKYNELINKNYYAFHEDFLNYSLSKKYDYVVACPPFKNNQDTVHIMKMYEHLYPGGIMSTLTSPLWVMNNEEHQVKFREWLSDKTYSMKMLPDNSFIEGYKTVPTCVLRIEKPS